MELWDAYDADGKRTGILLERGKPIPDSLYHLVAEIVVQHTDGSILIMQRDSSKNPLPGLWQASAGGSALAGETSETAARRELLEETGLTAGELVPLYRRREDVRHAFYHGYLTRYDGNKNDILLQPGETQDHRWLSPADFLAFVQTDAFISFHRDRLQDWLKTLQPAPCFPCKSVL